MSAIAPDRPFFAPASKGQGAGLGFNAPKALKEAQAAFFRPVAATVSVETTPVAQAQSRTEAAAVPASAAAAFKRPGSYLDIRV